MASCWIITGHYFTDYNTRNKLENVPNVKVYITLYGRP